MDIKQIQISFAECIDQPTYDLGHGKASTQCQKWKQEHACHETLRISGLNILSLCMLTCGLCGSGMFYKHQ